VNVLETLLTLAGAHAQTVLLEFKLCELSPTWLLVNADGHCSLIETPWRDDAQKELIWRQLRAAMAARNTVAYSFITEAWVAQLTPEQWNPDAGPLPEGLRPAKRADRQEVVLALAADKTSAQWRQWTIVRDHLEQIIRLDPRPFATGEQAPESWMTELLK